MLVIINASFSDAYKFILEASTDRVFWVYVPRVETAWEKLFPIFSAYNLAFLLNFYSPFKIQLRCHLLSETFLGTFSHTVLWECSLSYSHMAVYAL